jgi:hypothetical protein
MTHAMHVTDRVKLLKWFAHVGENTPIECDVEVIRLSSWTDAVAHCASAEWEETQLAARNATTQYLSAYHRDEYQKWNLYAAEAKQVLAPDFERLAEYLSTHGLDKIVGDSTRWDIYSAVLQEQYWHLGVPKFFLDLFPFYEAGHFPCGWRGEWPKGALVIF